MPRRMAAGPNLPSLYHEKPFGLMVVHSDPRSFRDCYGLCDLARFQPAQALLMVVAEPHNILHQARKPVNGPVEPVTPFLGLLRQRFDILGAFPHGGIGDPYGFRVDAYGFSVLLHHPLKTIETLFSSGSHHASFLGLAANFISSELG